VNADPVAWRLQLARACAWALLVSGWVGIGSLAFMWTANVLSGFALVALWLIVLGAAAARVSQFAAPPPWRAAMLLAAACVGAAGLWNAAHGGSLAALVVTVLGFGALTALASGVVRRLRVAQRAAPNPPIAAAGIGALVAGLVLGDIGNVQALALRLGAFGLVIASLLALLPLGVATRTPPPGCRAGLFDCSLPAWPAGAWRELAQWPTLLAGLAMLPMMAALPLMAAWCRAESIAPQAMLMLHLAAMFGPVWLWRSMRPHASSAALAAGCAALLAAGAAIVAWAPAPLDLLGLALTHGAAWGLAWGGQLWAPARRAQQGTSPLRAALGYALLTLAFGALVDRYGTRGVALTHAALGLTAAAAWVISAAAKAAAPDASAPRPGPGAAHPDHRAGGR
jgi:hypothetical protein